MENRTMLRKILHLFGVGYIWHTLTAIDMEETTERLLQQALNSAKSGNKEAARKALSQVVTREPQNARAWYLLSQLTTTDKETIYCLEKVLRIHPDNEKIKSRLSQVLSSEQTKSVSSEQHGEQIKPQSTDNLQFPKSDSNISEANPPPVTKPLTKKCPYCAEIIRADAIVCRYCGRNLVTQPNAPQKMKVIKKKSYSPLAYVLITACFFLCLCCFAGSAIYGMNSNNSGNSSSTSGSFNEAKAIQYVQNWKPRNNKGMSCKDTFDAVVYVYRDSLGISDARVEWSATKLDEQSYTVFARLKGETGWANYSWKLSIPNMTISTSENMTLCPP